MPPDWDIHSLTSPYLFWSYTRPLPTWDKRQKAGGGTEHSHRRPTCICLMLTICIGTCTHTGTQEVCTVILVLRYREQGFERGLGMVHKDIRLYLSLPGLTTVFRWSPAPLGIIAQVTVGGQLSLASRGAQAPAVRSQSSLPFSFKFLPSFVITRFLWLF